MNSKRKKTTKKTPKPLSKQHRRINALLADPRQSDTGKHELRVEIDEMMNNTDINLDRPEFFPKAFTLATQTIERTKTGYFARRAYRAVQDALARVEAGESLEEIARDREARLREDIAQKKRERLNAPEPKDKLSDEWRYWKIAQITEGMGGRDKSQEAYNAAWDEFRELFEGLRATPSFWHVDNALALLPHLIIARQEIDRLDQQQRRSDAAVKGARTRKGARKNEG